MLYVEWMYDFVEIPLLFIVNVFGACIEKYTRNKHSVFQSLRVFYTET